MFDLDLSKLWKASKDYHEECEKNTAKRKAEDDRLKCEIHVNVNIWRHSLDDPTEVASFVLSYHGCHRWTWEEIEWDLASRRWAKDTEGRLVDLNVAAIKLVSAVKDITDTEKQVSWHEIVKESNDNSEQ